MNMKHHNLLMETFSALGSERYAPRATFLLHQGDDSDAFFVCRRGLAKAYYVTIDGKEFIKSFIKENDCIGSMQVILAGNPASFNLLTLEDSYFLEVPGARLTAAVEHNANLLSALNGVLMQVAMKKERREYEFLCLSAEQRYRRFCEREPELLQRLPQCDVARYLGITPVALSRIRRRRVL